MASTRHHLARGEGRRARDPDSAAADGTDVDLSSPDAESWCGADGASTPVVPRPFDVTTTSGGAPDAVTTDAVVVPDVAVTPGVGSPPDTPASPFALAASDAKPVFDAPPPPLSAIPPPPLSAIPPPPPAWSAAPPPPPALSAPPPPAWSAAAPPPPPVPYALPTELFLHSRDTVPSEVAADSAVGEVVDAPVVDTPVADEMVADEMVADEMVVDTPVADEMVADEMVADEMVADEMVADTPVFEAPVFVAPVVGEAVVDAPVVDAPVVDAPVVDGATDDPGAVSDAGVDVDRPVVDAPVSGTGAVVETDAVVDATVSDAAPAPEVAPVSDTMFIPYSAPADTVPAPEPPLIGDSLTLSAPKAADSRSLVVDVRPERDADDVAPPADPTSDEVPPPPTATAPTPPARTRPPRRAPVRVVLSLVAAAGLAGATLAGWQWSNSVNRQARQSSDRQAEAVAARVHDNAATRRRPDGSHGRHGGAEPPAHQRRAGPVLRRAHRVAPAGRTGRLLRRAGLHHAAGPVPRAAGERSDVVAAGGGLVHPPAGRVPVALLHHPPAGPRQCGAQRRRRSHAARTRLVQHTGRTGARLRP